MEIVEYILLFLAGLGLFIKAMDMTGKNMQSILGQSITKKLQKLSKRPVTGSLLGTGGTIALQSSTAMIVLLISFVQIGTFSLAQSLPIVIGVNIGASVIFLTLLANAFNVSLIFASLTIIGAFISILCKNKRAKSVGNVIFAFGLLFLGLYLIALSMSFLKSLDFVSNLFETLTHPVLLVLLGIILSLLTQSSQATNAILIPLVVTSGDVGLSLASALWISVGSRIGPTSAGLLASMGNHRSTKILALFHLMFNVVALILFAFSTLTHWVVWLESFNNPALAIVVFNIICSVVTGIVLLPLCKPASALLGYVMKNRRQKEDVFEMDENLFMYPELAFAQIDKQVAILFESYTENLNKLTKYCFDESDKTKASDIEKLNYIFYNQLDKTRANLSSLDLNISDEQKTNIYYYYNVIGRLKSLTDRIRKIVRVFSTKKPTNQFTKEQISLANELVLNLNKLNAICYKFIVDDENEEMVEQLLNEAFKLESEITRIKLQVKEKIIYSYQNATSRVRYTDNYARLINQLEQIGEHYSAICFFDEKFPEIENENNKNLI